MLMASKNYVLAQKVCLKSCLGFVLFIKTINTMIFFVIFTRLNIDHEDNFIEISVNEPFMFLLNESRFIYTLTELLKHSKLDDGELDLDDISF